MGFKSNHPLDQQELALEAAYTRYRPLLMTALGHLAKQGCTVPPGDGLDLIHDFFVDAWPGITSNFKSDRGKLSTYVFAAFVRFARPRIVRTQRWQRQLDDIDVRDGARIDRDVATELPSAAANADKIRTAFESLSEDYQKVLSSVVVSGQSIRDAAKQQGTSRHAARECLVEGLSALAVVLGETGELSPIDVKIARALLIDQLPLGRVAEEMGITRAQAEAARTRILDPINRAISSTSQRKAMMTKTDDRLCALWKRIVQEPRATAQHKLARENLDELLDHVDECVTCRNEPAATERLTELYEALGADDLDESDQAMLDQMLSARANSEDAVGTALQLGLLQSLPDRLASISDDLQIEPLTLFRAMDAVARLVHRFAITARHPAGTTFGLDTDGSISLDGRIAIPVTTVEREMMRLARVDASVARGVLEWLNAALREHAYVLRGIRSRVVGGKLLMELTKLDPAESLFDRWSQPMESPVRPSIPNGHQSLIEVEPAREAAKTYVAPQASRQPSRR